MITAAIYGRLGRDPEERAARNGNKFLTAPVAVDVARGDADDLTEWISISAFGRVADDLSRHSKGDLIGAMGKLTKTTYTDRDGNDREQWQFTCDAIVSAKAIRPGGRRRYD